MKKGISFFVLLAMAGCVRQPNTAADSEVGKRASRFPSADALRKLGESSPPTQISRADVFEAQQWDLVDPPAHPDGSSPHVPASRWERLLADKASARSGLLFASEAMNCTARQIGQFYLSEQAIPDDTLMRFMSGRCGAPETEVSFAFQAGVVPDSANDDAVFSQTREASQKLLDQNLAAGNQVAGLWYGRQKGKMVIMLAFAARRVVFQQAPIAPDERGHVVFQGELLVPAERMEILINYGPFGYRQCAVDPTVKLPRFAADCEVNRSDSSAVVEFGAFPAGRIVGHIVAQHIVWPGGEPGAHFARGGQFEERSGARSETPADLAQTLFGALNEARAAAGLRPVKLATDESATAARLAPHYFAGLAGQEPETSADVVVLGVRAGWQVPALIHNGLFAATLVRGVEHPTRLIDEALLRPTCRQALFDPDANWVAVGPVAAADRSSLAAVFGTYSALPPTPDRGEADAVFAALGHQRAERHVAPPSLHRGFMPIAAEQARLIAEGRTKPESALKAATQRGTQVESSLVHAWFISTNDLKQIPFPTELLNAASAKVAIGIAHYRPEGDAWGAYGILILGTTTEASSASPGGAVAFATEQ